MGLEKNAPTFGFEWSVIRSGWATGICVRRKVFTAFTVYEVNFLPIIMNKRCCRENAGLKPLEPCPGSGFCVLIQPTSYNKLRHTFGIARGSMPILVIHIDGVEFFVSFVDCHFGSFPGIFLGWALKHRPLRVISAIGGLLLTNNLVPAQRKVSATPRLEFEFAI